MQEVYIMQNFLLHVAIIREQFVPMLLLLLFSRMTIIEVHFLYFLTNYLPCL